MADDIRLDVAPYYNCRGRMPSGRGYWPFRIVSPIVTAHDHDLRMPEEMAFKDACDRALEVAALRKAKKIILLPE
jgi:hypothetical protein